MVPLAPEEMCVSVAPVPYYDAVSTMLGRDTRDSGSIRDNVAGPAHSNGAEVELALIPLPDGSGVTPFSGLVPPTALVPVDPAQTRPLDQELLLLSQIFSVRTSAQLGPITNGLSRFNRVLDGLTFTDPGVLNVVLPTGSMLEFCAYARGFRAAHAKALGRFSLLRGLEDCTTYLLSETPLRNAIEEVLESSLGDIGAELRRMLDARCTDLAELHNLPRSRFQETMERTGSHQRFSDTQVRNIITDRVTEHLLESPSLRQHLYLYLYKNLSSTAIEAVAKDKSGAEREWKSELYTPFAQVDSFNHLMQESVANLRSKLDELGTQLSVTDSVVQQLSEATTPTALPFMREHLNEIAHAISEEATGLLFTEITVANISRFLQSREATAEEERSVDRELAAQEWFSKRTELLLWHKGDENDSGTFYPLDSALSVGETSTPATLRSGGIGNSASSDSQTRHAYATAVLYAGQTASEPSPKDESCPGIGVLDRIPLTAGARERYFERFLSLLEKGSPEHLMVEQANRQINAVVSWVRNKLHPSDSDKSAPLPRHFRNAYLARDSQLVSELQAIAYSSASRVANELEDQSLLSGDISDLFSNHERFLSWTAEILAELAEPLASELLTRDYLTFFRSGEHKEGTSPREVIKRFCCEDGLFARTFRDEDTWKLVRAKLALEVARRAGELAEEAYSLRSEAETEEEPSTSTIPTEEEAVIDLSDYVIPPNIPEDTLRAMIREGLYTRRKPIESEIVSSSSRPLNLLHRVKGFIKGILP